ncbi:MAG: hypothetical protein IJW00_09145 [Clostridia bacterium]|nr:hypothetical protein [Clostridia bacterium]
MSNKDKKIVVTVAGLSPKEQKKVTGRLVKAVMKDKGYRKAVAATGKKITEEAAEAAARVAVSEALGTNEGADNSVTLHTSGLDLYADLVARFAKARRKKIKNEKKAAKKYAKDLKKKGGKLDKKTGLIKLMKAEKLKKAPMAKKHKPYKAKKKK